MEKSKTQEYNQIQLEVPLVAKKKVKDASYYGRYALAGGACCAITHGSVVPIDVIKTRLQISDAYKSFSDASRSIYAKEGIKGFSLGLGSTVIGYGIQGSCKFGFFELFKNLYYEKVDKKYISKDSALNSPSVLWAKTLGVNIVTSALAETIGTLMLAPWEALRIRTVDKPQIFKGMSMMKGIGHIFKTEGLYGFTNSLGPILLKQIPYTCTQLTAFSMLNEYIDHTVLPKYFHVEKNELAAYNQLLISALSGTIAGVISGIASHPADTLLSKVNAMSSEGKGIKSASWIEVYKRVGFRNLWVGLGPRCLMVGMMSAIMFLIYDSVRMMVGLSLQTKKQ